MKPLSFRETVSFGVVNSSDDLSTTSVLEETFDLRVKEGFTLGKALVPERFSDTIFLGEGNVKRKNYRSVVSYKTGSKPMLYSETCYLTSKRKDLKFRSEIERDSSSKQKAVNRWFANSIDFEVRRHLCDEEDAFLNHLNRSGKVVLSGTEKFRAESSIFENECDYNQNITQGYDTRRR